MWSPSIRCLKAAVLVTCSAASAQSVAVSGSYIGNGLDNQAVAVGFLPDFVMIQSEDGKPPIARTSTMPTDSAKAMTGLTEALPMARIRALTPTGFILGPDLNVNMTGVTYHWMAFRGLSVGSYVGDATTAKFITGLGCVPEAVFIIPESTFSSTFRVASMQDAGYDFGGGAPYPNGLLSFQDAGFKLGNNSVINQAGSRYHYVAWCQGPTAISGFYLGNGVDNRSIGGVGFSPEYLLIRRASTNVAVQKPRSIGAAVDLTFAFSLIPPQVDHIQVLEATGFQIGANGRVNIATGDTYWWFAVATWDGGSGDAGSDAGLDAGPPDAGPPDAGPPDAGPPDAGPPDAGPPDAGPPDAGPPDAGPPDSGTPDSGSLDSGSLDSGSLDSGSLDSGSLDSGSLDSGSLDSGELDSGSIDSGEPDSGSADSGSLDSGAGDSGTQAPDGGTADGGFTNYPPLSAGCDCGAANALPMLATALLLFATSRRRRRL